jgi:pseudaminic acid synthase
MRRLGPGQPVYIIAELSANHGQSLDKALALVRAAKDAGADAIKLQTYTPDTMTIQCDKKYFRIGNGSLWTGRNLYDLYGEAYTPWEWQPRLRDAAAGLGLDLFSTPFDATAVEFLERMAPPAYKIASFEMVDLELIRCVARTHRPMIMATGMCTLSEIEEAVTAAREAGATEIALLKCSSAYPAPAGQMNLRTIPHLAQTFGVPAGLSDHTLGIAAPVAAVALGASIIEKHFTLSRADPGPDTAFSLEPTGIPRDGDRDSHSRACARRRILRTHRRRAAQLNVPAIFVRRQRHTVGRTPLRGKCPFHPARLWPAVSPSACNSRPARRV